MRRSIRIVPILGAAEEYDRASTRFPPQKITWPVTSEVLMAFTLKDTQRVQLSVKFVDKVGNPAKVDGIPEWSVDNPNVAKLEPAADGLSCMVSAVGPLGTAKVTLKADADLGAGVSEIAGTFDLEVVASAASIVTIEAGTPEDI